MFGGGSRPLPVIEGSHTRLRPSTPDDLDLLLAWFSDPETYRFWGGRPLTRGEVRSKYTGIRPGVDAYVVEGRFEADGLRAIGYAQSWADTSGPPDALRGIDMFVAPAFRRRGYGLDAARALIRHLLLDEGWRAVTVDPAVDNPDARAFWAAVGFRVVRDWPDHPDGPAVLMSIGATTLESA